MKPGRMIKGLVYQPGNKLDQPLDWPPSPPLATDCRVLFSSGLNLRIIFNTGTKWARSSALLMVKNCKI